MKAFKSLLIAATLTLAWAQTNGDQIMTQPEAQLIKILKNSHAPLFDRAKACQRLAVVGTRKAVPALGDSDILVSKTDSDSTGIEPQIHVCHASGGAHRIGQGLFVEGLDSPIDC